MKWAEAIWEALGIGGKRLSLLEERQAVRVPCEVDACLPKTGEMFVMGKMTDVSPLGIRLEMPEALREGERAAVILRGSTLKVEEVQLEGRVVWCRRTKDGFSAGLNDLHVVGEAGVDVLTFLRVELAVPVMDHQRRKHRRVEVDWPIDVRTSDGVSHRGMVRDAGLFGVQFVTDADITVDATLDLTIQLKPPVHVQALVRRCMPADGGFVTACSFATLGPAERATLEAALKRQLGKA